MTRHLFARRSWGTMGVLLLLLCGATILASCGGEKFGDPNEFYDKLVKAANTKDGGYMYDILDSARRVEIDTLISMQMANLDKLPDSERPMWDSLKGKSKRDIYGRIIANDQGITEVFKGSYKVLKVDTLVVLTVQHEGQQPNILYLRPHGDKYMVAFPPRPPAQAMPEGHPPVDVPQQGGQPSPAPGGTGTAPSDTGKK
jgi:hypothetical protein